MAGFFRKFTKGFLITCNIIIAVIFLLGCYAAHFNPERFWFFGFFTLASVYLLILLLLFIFFWFFAKKKMMLISVIAVLLAWQPLGHLIKLKFSPDFKLQKDSGNFRVMSWNVEHFDILEHKTHPERKGEMLDLINEYRPDIACFQEVVGSDLDSTAINYIPSFAKRLEFPDYLYSYYKKDDFDSKHHFGIIIFSRYPILNRQTVSYPPGHYNSYFQYVDILKGTDTFRVFNIHLQSLKFTGANLQYIDDPTMQSEVDIERSKNIISKFHTGFLKRKIQSERIKDAMKASPYPVIVCGDFNDVPNSYAYSTIGKGMKNCFAEKGSGIGRTFSSISPTLRIDNIFTDQRFDTKQYVRVKKKISDHFPIIADLEFNR